MRVTLHEGWSVRAAGGELPAHMTGAAIPATVPGTVHLDLLAAGLIPDPYLDSNESLVAWVGYVDWRYETTFAWTGTSEEHVDLVAEGLDTVARVELNGVEIAATRNMHRTYRVPVAHLLREGTNTLAVTFAAGIPAAERADAELGPRPNVNTHPYHALRKMACNYGWDWGPELVTAGIWRPLALETWSTARIASVRPLVDVRGTTGVLTAHVEIERADDRDLDVEVTVAGQRGTATLPGGATSATVNVEVPDVALWWPRGYGEQPMSDVAVTLSTVDGSLDDWYGRVGFRTVTLDTEPDAHGTPFTLAVNGVPVFARGVNWIPDDCFPSRIDRARYAARLRQAYDANVNLVRVWGGGIYESDDFYDVCDELGLLVWQDFLFACAAYAEEEPLRSEVAAEAVEAVTRLSPHPSLVLWNGGNENIWGYEDWDWKPVLGDRTWGLGYYTDLLPGIVAALDPTRPYSPGSPYSFRAGRHPNDPEHGTMHIWDVWNQRDYTAYREYRPRFVAEFGFQGPPSWATLVRAIHDDPRVPDSPAMLVHQKAAEGNDKLIRGLVPHLPEPASFDDWHWATSLNQARAMRIGVEHLRSLSPLCAGAVVWQLNDCWPVTSWAAVDGDGRRKQLWYALRAAFADRLLTLQPRDGGLVLVAVNDTDRPWTGTATANRVGFDGTVLAGVEVSLAVPARGTATLPLPSSVADPVRARRELVVACAGELRTHWFFAEDRDADLPEPLLDVEVVRVDGGYRVEVTARALLRDLSLLVDRAAPDAVVDQALVTLLPGERAAFTVTTGEALPVGALTDPRVLRCANQLVMAAGVTVPVDA